MTGSTRARVTGPARTGHDVGGLAGSHRILLVAGVVAAPATLAMAMAAWSPAVQMSEYWGLTAAYAVTLSPSWQGRRPERSIWTTAAAVLAPTALVGAVVMGWAGVWVALANLAIAILFLALSRRILDHDGWAPRAPSHLIGFMLACLTCSVVGVALGAFPGLGVAAFDFDRAVWWTTRNIAHLWIGAVCFFLLLYPRSCALPRPTRTLLGLLGIAGVIGMYLPRANAELPIAWIPLVPALWAGLTLTPRSAAGYALLTSIASAAAATLHPQAAHYDGALSDSSVVDLLMVFSSLLTILLTLTRQRRACLEEAIEQERLEAEDTAELFETVLDSMSDGLVLATPEGVALHNPAAHRMLGRPPPVDPPDSWARYFGFRTADGSREVTDEELSLTLEDGLDSRRPKDFSVADASGDARVVSALAHRLHSEQGEQGERVLLLLRDVTAERSRDQKLRGFAATVAHDLLGPLDALAGWIETADEELADEDVAAGRLSLGRAREAARRMGRLIDDYLALTVTREGLLRLGEVPLAELVREVTESYDSDTSGGPTFDIDVSHVSRADRALTRQLLANLVGNAVEHARPQRSAYVTLISRDDATPGWVEFSVADRGTGIQGGQEEHLFAAFRRGDAVDSYDRAGLGLALCHSIVARHGGQITAEGNEHGGATIRFTLPKA